MTVDTGLVAWAWASDQKSPGPTPSPAVTDGKLVGTATDATGESFNDDSSPSARPALKSRSSKKSVKVKTASSSADGDQPVVNDEVASRRRSTDPEGYRPPAGGTFKTSPRPLSPQSSGIGKQTRRRLLGNRKLSNLSKEEEHFKTHRDSRCILNRGHEEIVIGHHEYRYCFLYKVHG